MSSLRSTVGDELISLEEFLPLLVGNQLLVLHPADHDGRCNSKIVSEVHQLLDGIDAFEFDSSVGRNKSLGSKRIRLGLQLIWVHLAGALDKGFFLTVTQNMANLMKEGEPENVVAQMSETKSNQSSISWQPSCSSVYSTPSKLLQDHGRNPHICAQRL